jgi:anti-anti-sigma regulatory factor
MILRIEYVRGDSGTVLFLSGRITSPDVQDLKARVAEEVHPVALDLQQVRLVDLDAVHFLASAERRGLELCRVPRYVREWIHAETRRLGDLE